MATSMANSATHQINLASLPSVPRIRPPRLLKGDPHPNNTPQPAGQPPRDRLWVQGKWRHPTSNATKHKRDVQVRQVTKALRHRTHGLDIYAYRHVRTNQVVYSLSRSLQNSQVLKQMLFHGKKTVPAAVRRDMWTPYFSVHFPENLAGSYVGLSAFKRLRELSTQRQLSPTKSMLTATQDDVDIAKSKLGGPLQVQRLEQSDKWQDKEKLSLKLPKEGELLPKKLRARRMMDQKATSVADIAFVLDWISSGPGPVEKMIAIETDRVVRHKDRTRKARARVNAAARAHSQKEAEIEERAKLVSHSKGDDDRTNARLTPVQLERLSMEHQTIMNSSDGVLQEGHKEKLISAAEEQWRALNPIQPQLIDLEEYKERKAISQAAEHEALKTFYSAENTSSSDPNASIWTHVKEKREAALAKFDEDFKERKRSAALAQAAVEATTEYETIKTTTGDPAPSIQDLIAEKQKVALENLEKQEAAKQRLRKSNSTWSESWNIKMYWADLNDGLFARSWPQNVIHGLLEPYAVSKTSPNGGEKSIPKINKSIHVIGGGLNDGWMPHELLAGNKSPKPKVEWETVKVDLATRPTEELEQQPLSNANEYDSAPIEQPSPPELSLFARLRQSVFGR
ncbi:uncharacterized protein A1O9_10988 [Exophiala aquamarina CBS 119918]|uniref:Large ribosomal subunit protein mL67 n=1 Tax=Exophiala aquamarina CBS 119918 TaxID=1182545 RepID=A0A072PBW4_9EURO|nr:uncharacterized protein A1O9_10988 [Exophiala aquamarina CBS 119918]KEF53080.1 hypothetical protein A1O9_10988 [Exophiala aquamarina CBS 119918]